MASSYKFDWDPFKEISNLQKHGVSFEEAMEVFEDPLSLSIYDEDHSFNEDRWITLGMCLETGLLLVVHTWIEKQEDEIL